MPERTKVGDRNTSRVDPTDATKPRFGLPPPSFLPRRYKPRNVGEWTGHLTFASDLIVALQPSLIVELGTHWGEAYFTFCQTVQEHGLSSLCYAVDHWLGDEHAGHYGEEVYDEVTLYNDRFYRQFSYLLRRSFDEALAQFVDNSIDLLHIDGLHTYDAVTHDFRGWLPKVRPGGFVLLHDICPRHQDFGVWRLWDEITSEFPDTFEFHHSWGLGVLRKDGGDGKTLLEELLFHSSPAVREDVRRYYVIYASHLEHLLGRMPALPAPAPNVVSEVRVKVFPCVDGAYSEEASQVHKMSSGAWSTLVFDLRYANMSGPLRVDPGYEPSFIEIGDILIHSGEAGELMWSSAASSPERHFQVGGTALPYPDDPSFLLNVGDNPNILLHTPPEVRGPLRLTITLKVMPVAMTVMDVVHSRLQSAWADAAQKLTEAAQELTEAAQKIAAAEQERKLLATELAANQSQLNDALSARDAALSARDAALSARNEAQTELDKMRQVLVQVQNSASWRLTSPLRRLMAALRGPR